MIIIKGVTNMEKLNNVDKVSIAALLLMSISLTAAFVLSPLSGLALGANSLSSNVIGTVTVPSTCFATVSNTAINFGSLAPTAQYAPANLVVDSNAGGNVAANIVVSGTDWTSGGNTFLVTNTVWNPTNTVTFTPSNDLTAVPVDTHIQISAGGSGNIYFGVQIPPGQAVGTYTQNIIVESSC